ncbi:MAG: glycerol-3-phosphate acyltransferase [Anaerolineales bacterium]|nr:glycerol-3-phosphate acyltransferase [Anaerolineales bacterium]
MPILVDAGLLLAAYLFGSIPVGLIIVKIFTGQDVRKVESGRTGGTNVYRAAGFGAGLATALLDILKAASTVWLARAVTDTAWIHALVPVAAILGHNYSIFLAERGPEGRLRLRGGAGGAAAFGGIFGLWWPAGLIMFPLGFLIWFIGGYASVTTMSVPLMGVIIFTVRALLGQSPWEYVLYGVLAEILLVWALRPNIKRLREGTERLHGLRAWWRKRRQAQEAQPPSREETRARNRPAHGRRREAKQASGPRGTG